MKKKDKKIIIGILIGVVALILINQMYPLSLLMGGTELNCQDSSTNTWSCGLTTGQYIPATSGLFNIPIREPSDADERVALLCSKVSSVTSTSCEDECSTSVSPRICMGNLATSSMGNNLLVVSGTYEYNGQTYGFKTYGFCETADRKCSLNEPNLDNVPDTARGQLNLIPDSLVIHFKEGGYTNVCIEPGIEKCEGTNLFICEGVELVNQGEVVGKCGVTDGNGGGNGNGDEPKPYSWIYAIVGVLLAIGLLIFIYFKIK